MDKYLIRETSISNKPPYTGLYFAGFLSGGRGATMVFDKDNAQKYDTKQAVMRALVSVKELSGKDSWQWELSNPDHEFEFDLDESIGGLFVCKCGVHHQNHGV